MNTKIKKRIFIFLTIIIAIMIILLIVFLNNRFEKNKIISKEEAYEFPDEEEVKNSNEIYNYFNRGIYIEIYNILKALSSNIYSSDVMMNILDEEYIDYYKIDKNNIIQKIDAYKNERFNLKNVEYAENLYGDMYIFIVTLEDDQQIIIKYSSESNKYKIFLPDYIKDIGKDAFINEKILKLFDGYVQGNQFNIGNGLSYTDKTALENYFDIFYDLGFDYVYNNFMSKETKEMYTYSELNDFYFNLLDIFYDSEPIDLTTSKDDNNYTTYSFKDTKHNEYIIHEEGWNKFEILINNEK